MLDLLRRHALETDEQQEQLAIELMKAAAAEIVHGEPDPAALTQFMANQSWSKEEAKKRLAHLISLLNGFRDNRLRDCALRIAQSVSDELD